MNQVLAAQQTHLARLKEILAVQPPALLALSGGLDSRFLAQAAWNWGFELTPAFFSGPHVSPDERAWVREWTAAQGRELRVIEIGPLDFPLAAANGPDRCYHCKRGLFERAWELAREMGLPRILDGTNASDQSQHRPGLKALAELGVVSPLAQAGFTKSQVRQAARKMDLSRPDQPSRACLMTRFAYGHAPSRAELELLGRAEDALMALGLADLRLRRPGEHEYVLQLSEAEAALWECKGQEALDLLAGLGLEPVRVEICRRVSGYYD